VITGHLFVPAPFYPDRCGGHVQDRPGYSVICGAPGRDHESCDGTEGHVSEVRTETNTTGMPYARCKECWLYLGSINFNEDGTPEALRVIHSEETKMVVDMRCQKYRDAIGQVMELLRRQPGGMAAKIKQILSEVES